MAVTTYTALHQQVLATIQTILETGQSVSYRGRQWSAANLAELNTMEKDYRKLAAAEAGKATRSRVSYITPVV